MKVLKQLICRVFYGHPETECHEHGPRLYYRCKRCGAEWSWGQSDYST